MSTQNKNGNKPVATLRDGAIKATIWRNEVKTDGKANVFFSVDISRTYQDENDQYHDTHSFSGGQLLQVSRMAQKAYDRLVKLRLIEKLNEEDEGAQ
mgnify:CR=1 FL=1